MTKLLNFFKQHQLKAWSLIKERPWLFPAVLVASVAIGEALSWLFTKTTLEFWMQAAISQLLSLPVMIVSWRYLLGKKKIFRPSKQEVISFVIFALVLGILALVSLQIWFLAMAEMLSITELILTLVAMVVGSYVALIRWAVMIPLMVDKQIWIWQAARQSWHLTKTHVLYLATLVAAYVVISSLLPPELDLVLSYATAVLVMVEAAALYFLIE